MRTCTCPPGYAGTANLTGSDIFLGCTGPTSATFLQQTSLSLYNPPCSCGDSPRTVPVNFIPTRLRLLILLALAFLSSLVSLPLHSVLIIRSDIDECQDYGCGSSVSGIVCTMPEINKRTCTCPLGYNGTLTLIGTQPFPGCTGPLLSSRLGQFTSIGTSLSG